ncbi:TATA box-binding protein-associated factor RNA polymerase I subunit D [Rhinatrema bivittatum]|uniref:TATA box-binding protein-associated factor RNA polymerase I subunit D n=1 Tax=Rhinatrema bivittatum TaxID=194408 RepID=UPI001125E8F0|nr:TATA box-binding protein-associated factor RNA polymerase I subunit D [Rhinatrema bivittatum]
MIDNDEDEDLRINATGHVQNLISSPEELLRAGKDKAKHMSSGSPQDEALGSKCAFGDGFSNSITLLPATSCTDLQDLDSDSLSSGDNLFQTQCTYTPQRATRSQKSASHVSRSSAVAPPEDSADSSSEPTPLHWRQIFHRHFSKKKYVRKKREKYRYRYKKRGTPMGRPPSSIPLLEQKRRLKDRGFQFPFVAKRELPFPMILTYEQAALGGFFQYMDKIKCERHLQTSLHGMDEGESSEQEALDLHRHQYLDDDGPVSPIQEPNKEYDPTEPDEYDAKIVENSCFILSCNIPIKKRRRKKI